MFERIKETWRALQGRKERQRLQNMREWRVVEKVFQNLARRRQELKEEQLQKLRGKEFDLRSLLWEIRHHLQYKEMQSHELLKVKVQGRMLGVKLEKALKERDLPSSPPRRETLGELEEETRK